MKSFIIEQKVTLMANQYRIFKADEAGEKQERIAFAHQKRLAFKEKFHFYTDESKQHILFSVQARKVLDLGTRYDVSDEHGTKLGVFGKAFKESLLRSTWHVFKPDAEQQPIAVVQERNKALAIFRRVWQVVPYIGELPFFLKYHFDFVRPKNGQVLGALNKITTFRDHYRLTIEDELASTIDWRPLVALAVLLDALQSR